MLGKQGPSGSSIGWHAGLAIAAALAWAPLARPSLAEELRQIRDEVNGVGRVGSSGDTRSSDDSDSHHKSYDPDDDDDDSLFGWLVLGLVTSPWWGPHAMVCDNFGTPGFFPQYPYEASRSGMIIGSLDPVDDPHCPEDLSKLLRGGERNTWTARLGFECASEFDDVSRFGTHFLLSTTSRFDLDLEASRFEERLGSGELDQLWIGDANLTFRFAQCEGIQFRSGLGMNWMDDGPDAELGFNFTYGVDMFPGRPWLVSANLDWGTLGHAELFRFRTTVSVILNRFEIYSGYEYLDLDNTQFNTLLAGTGVWF